MRTMATLRVMGDGSRTASGVTAKLGIEPSEFFETGAKISDRSEKTRSHSAWLIRSGSSAEEKVELADSLLRVIERVEPVAASLWELQRDGYQVNWFCYLGSHATEHAAILDRRTLQRLLALPGELWLDVYSDADGAD